MCSRQSNALRVCCRVAGFPPKWRRGCIWCRASSKPQKPSTLVGQISLERWGNTTCETWKGPPTQKSYSAAGRPELLLWLKRGHGEFRPRGLAPNLKPLSFYVFRLSPRCIPFSQRAPWLSRPPHSPAYFSNLLFLFLKRMKDSTYPSGFHRNCEYFKANT